MSTYTKNSGIEKPVPGSQEGTWGGTANTNYDLLDDAINGLVTITLTTAGTSGTPNTLEITDGATSNGRNRFIEFDDDASLAGADVYVQLTETGGSFDAERIIWFKNTLGTGDNLYLFQGTYSAARDYVIANGETALVRFTGGTASTCSVFPIMENILIEGTVRAIGAITGSNLSGSNTGDNAGVTSVATTGAITGGPITATGTIAHSAADGFIHIPAGGASGNFVKYASAGTGAWAALAVADLSDYIVPAMYDSGGTPTLTVGITAAEYRTAIGAGTSSTVGTVTQVDGGSGLTGTVTASGSLAVGAGTGVTVNANDVALDYLGADSFIGAATDLEGTDIAAADSLLYSDATDGNIKKGLVSDLPTTAGGVTSVAAGNGLDFTTITATGSVTLGTPGASTASSTDAVTATSHTHSIDSTIARVLSPALTGTPTAPTQAVDNNSTRIATTAFVVAQIADDAPLKDGTGATGTWGIAISGNAATASTATFANTCTTAADVSSAAQPNITSVGTLTSLQVTGESITNDSFVMVERASAPTNTTGRGKLWTKNTVPAQLWFTDDATTDEQVNVGVQNKTTVTNTSSTTNWPMLASSSSGDALHRVDTDLTYNATTNTLSVGVLDATSARSKKTQVGTPNSSDDLKHLKPIFYTLNADSTKKVHTGYFADEVDDYFPEMVSYDDAGVPAGIDYSRFVIPLVMKVNQLEKRLEAGGL